MMTDVYSLDDCLIYSLPLSVVCLFSRVRHVGSVYY